MGDDTYGQTGCNPVERGQSGPFSNVWVVNPKLIPAFENKKISRIFTNGDHNFAITTN